MKKLNKNIKFLLWNDYKKNNVTLKLLLLIIPKHNNKRYNAISMPSNDELKDAYNGWYHSNITFDDINSSIKILTKAGLIIKYQFQNNKRALLLPLAKYYIRNAKKDFLREV